jgi:plastocyanin
MRDSLDSRALARTDCYAQRFMKPGDYPYDVVPAYGELMSTDRPFVVRVKHGDKTSGMEQHNARVTRSGGRFKISDPEITIDVGDLVLWNCVDDGGKPFAVVGEHDFFGSSRLVNECGFTHAFGTPGDYHWVDAHGSATSGTVRVRDPGVKNETDLKRWQERLSDGTVVTITDDEAQPSDLEIVTGQTVFFAVVKSPGISITDARLLDAPPQRPETPEQQAG